MKKIFIVVNQDKFFLSHRTQIGIAAKEAGYDVTVVCKDTGLFDTLRGMGFKAVAMPINRTGTNLREELKNLAFLYRLFRRERPDLVHLVGLKIILWGSIASRLAGVKAMVSAVSGLGVLFDEKHSGSLSSRSILKVLRLTHRLKRLRVIFQNQDDYSIFRNAKIMPADKCAFTNGSGIDLDSYSYTPEPDDKVVKIIFTARMVEDKGALVLIDAAKKLEPQYRGRVQFLLCGGLDTNPNSISKEELESKCDGEYVKWLGHRSDIVELLKQSHIMAFPSWYREGLPKSIIEAQAIGRPVVTTDSVGCRDTVIDGENGYLIPVRDSEVLAQALQKLIDNPQMRRDMGLKARAFAERKFDVKDVVKVHLDIYKQLL